MKQTFVLLLTLMLILTASAAVAQLGEPVQDFTVVNENGTLTALSGLLQTKKAVLLHFFAGCWMKITAICPRFRRRMRNTGRISALSLSAWRNRKPCKALPPRGRRTS